MSNSNKPFEFTASDKLAATPTPEDILTSVVKVFGDYVEAIKASKPTVHDLMDHAKAIQTFKKDVVDATLAAIKKPVRDRHEETDERQLVNPRGVKSTLYGSDRVKWDRPKLESDLDNVDEYRSITHTTTHKIK